MYVSVSELRNKVEVGDIVSVPNKSGNGVTRYYIVSRVAIPKYMSNNSITLIDLGTGDNLDIRNYTKDHSYHNIGDSDEYVGTNEYLEEIERFVKDMGGTIYKNKNTYLDLYESNGDDDE